MSETTAEPARQVEWVSDLAFEGQATDDGRYMLPGAVDWRDLPIPLMALTETGPGGHEGAIQAGKITRIERDAEFDMDGNPLPEGVVAIRGHGVFDMGGENGVEAERLVREELVRGVSIDPAGVEAVLRDPDTGETFEPRDAGPDVVERAMFGELQTAFRKYTIGAATVCPVPAFADAKIAVVAGAGRTLVGRLLVVAESLTAGAAGLAPLRPPRAWFDTPEPSEPTPLTITSEGHVYGHMALWETCHTGYPGSCVSPPASPSGYAFFNLGEVECDDGSRVAVGAITLESLHAPTDRPLSPQAVKAHYENTGIVAAHVKASDGALGIWVAGALRPGLSERHARDLMGAKPSGDWRQVKPGGPLEMLGIHAVNEPGFPVPRLVASALTPSGDRAQIVFWDQAAVDRKLDVLAARAEGGLDALAELAGV